MPCTRPNANTTAIRVGLNLSVIIFSRATNIIERAIIGSIMYPGGLIAPYMDNPSVMVCATVNVVACHITGFNLGFNKKRLSTKRIWSSPRGRIWVKPSCM
jgi:hypothetical protein